MMCLPREPICGSEWVAFRYNGPHVPGEKCSSVAAVVPSCLNQPCSLLTLNHLVVTNWPLHPLYYDHLSLPWMFFFAHCGMSIDLYAVMKLIGLCNVHKEKRSFVLFQQGLLVFISPPEDFFVQPVLLSWVNILQRSPSESPRLLFHMVST